MDVPQQQPIQIPPANQFTPRVGVMSRFQSSRVSFSRDDTLTLDVRRKSAVSKLCGTGNYGSERKSDGTLFLREAMINPTMNRKDGKAKQHPRHVDMRTNIKAIQK
ncbi:hypothetical protein QE152_g25054 [Popillia japonica]|uniref:Uncharacterized protein n=1 Tax=Popillia japonica TaxID=7064 RepID=A0AAW1K462_POPJA